MQVMCISLKMQPVILTHTIPMQCSIHWRLFQVHSQFHIPTLCNPVSLAISKAIRVFHCLAFFPLDHQRKVCRTLFNLLRHRWRLLIKQYFNQISQLFINRLLYRIPHRLMLATILSLQLPQVISESISFYMIKTTFNLRILCYTALCYIKSHLKTLQGARLPRQPVARLWSCNK